MFRYLLIIAFFWVLLNSAFTQNPNDLDPPDGYRSMTTLKIAYVFKTLKLVDTKPEVPENITKYQDITYRIVQNDSLKLDIYHQKGIDSLAPLLVFIHGGGWHKGHRDDYRKYLIDFANKGYITATISYRFYERGVFPAALSDVKCAIQWLSTHAKDYHIDRENIAIIGGSAGGHLSMMAAYTSGILEYDTLCKQNDKIPKIKAVVNLYGPSDLTRPKAVNTSSVIGLIGDTYKNAPEKYLKASPMNYITNDDPPTLIFHGTIDELVPIEQSDILCEKLSEASVVNEYHRLKGWPHTMDLGLEINNYCQYYMVKFFDKHFSK